MSKKRCCRGHRNRSAVIVTRIIGHPNQVNPHRCRSPKQHFRFHQTPRSQKQNKTRNNIDTLEKIHRSAARFVVHDHRRTTSVTHNQSKLGWQTLETRRLHHQLIFLYKIKYNLNISLPQHLIVPCTQTRNSDSNKFVQIPTRINTYAYSFYPRVIRAWNLLPNGIIRLPSIDTFHQVVSTFKLAPPAHPNRL